MGSMPSGTAPVIQFPAKMKRLLLCLCLVASSLAITLDEAYQRCQNVERDELNRCVLKLINDLKPLIQKGIPELGMKAADIVNVNVFSVQENTGRDKVSAIFENGNIKGLDQYEMKYLLIDYDQRIVLWAIEIPDMLYTSRYVIDASLAYFPLKGNGTAWNRIKNFVLSGVSRFDVVDIDGELRLQEIESELIFTYKSMSMRLNNLYDGDHILEEAATIFLNSNTDLLVNVMKPSTKRFFRQVTGNFINEALSKIKLDDIAGSRFLKEAFLIPQ